MLNVTAFDPWAEEKRAWSDLLPHEREAAIQYKRALLSWEGVIDNIMVVEILRIEERVPTFCPVLSVPDRLVS